MGGPAHPYQRFASACSDHILSVCIGSGGGGREIESFMVCHMYILLCVCATNRHWSWFIDSTYLVEVRVSVSDVYMCWCKCGCEHTTYL